MKNKGIISAFISFVVLFLGIIFVLIGSITRNYGILVLGITGIILAGIAYIVLMLLGILWLRKRGGKSL